MAVSLQELIEQLKASGLLSVQDIEESLKILPEDGQSSEQLARLLVKRKVLTTFQAQQAYSGKSRALVLGNYLILDKLGQGGMGVVYKARHRRMDRVVALKVISRAAMKSPDSVKRFHREVQTAAKLTHPNIVIAFDADEAIGTHFLVMEYVEGTDLQTVVNQLGPLPLNTALNYIEQAARGLEYAHQQGIIHRDIKPANLLLDRKGAVKVLDMGLARFEDSVGGAVEGAGLTHTGSIMGTVDYMSPEQAMDTKHADARSDIYSLGCSLYYLLTGKVPYEGNTIMKRLMAHRSSVIPELNPTGAEETSREDHLLQVSAVNRMFGRMIAKAPGDRFQSMTDVLLELQRCQEETHSSPQANSRLHHAGPAEEFSDTRNKNQNSPQRVGREGTTLPERVRKETLFVKSDEKDFLATAQDSEDGTSQVEATLVTQAEQPTSPSLQLAVRGNSTRRRPPNSILIAAGAGAAALMILLGGLIIIRDRDGKEVTRVEIPEGGSATVTNSASSPLPASSPSGQWTPNPEQLEFINRVASLPPEEQVEAIRKKLQEINPGAEDLKTPYKVENGKVFEIEFQTDAPTFDLWPIQALKSLSRFIYRSSHQLSYHYEAEKGRRGVRDLSPLAGLPLDFVNVSGTLVDDLKPLIGLPLTSLNISGTHVSDFSLLPEMKLVDLRCSNLPISDLGLLIAMPLKKLICNGTLISDLAPLQGKQLDVINLSNTKVSDLTPLTGMPLKTLTFHGTEITDITPIKGMPLGYLDSGRTNITDLSPLQGMPLRHLDISYTNIVNCRPLQNLSLNTLSASFCRLSNLQQFEGKSFELFDVSLTRIRDLSSLQKIRVKNLRCSCQLFDDPNEQFLREYPMSTLNGRWPQGSPPEEFWKQLEERRNRAHNFAAEVSRLPGTEQTSRVSDKLIELNRGRVGAVETQIKDEQVHEASLDLFDGNINIDYRNMTYDLTPLMGFSQLKKLKMTGGMFWLDLSPLALLPLEEIDCSPELISRNLFVFQRMNQLQRLNGKPVAEVLDAVLLSEKSEME